MCIYTIINKMFLYIYIKPLYISIYLYLDDRGRRRQRRHNVDSVDDVDDDENVYNVDNDYKASKITFGPSFYCHNNSTL